MILLYGNDCVNCRQVKKMLDGNSIPYEYINIKGKTLSEIKLILKDDYEPGLRFPIVYENGKFITNIRNFIKRHDKKCILV